MNFPEGQDHDSAQAAGKPLPKRALQAPPEPLRPAEDLLHELQSHQIELEMQNQTLRVAQTALMESHDRYLSLYDFAPVPYLTLTDQGMIASINHAGVEMLGMRNRAELLQRPFASVVSPEYAGRWQRHFSMALKQEYKLNSELVLLKRDGSPLAVRMDSLPWTRNKQNVLLTVVLTDITARREADVEKAAQQEYLELQVRMRTNELHSVARQLLTTEITERRALAEDLHDGLGQNITLARLKLAELATRAEGQPSERFQQDLKEIHALLAHSGKEVRSLSAQLSPPVLTQFGLGAGLEWLAEELHRAWGLNVKLDLCDAKMLDATTTATLFRIVRELLLNTVKHSQISQAEVIMVRDEDSGQLEITIADEGIGFDLEQKLVPGLSSGYGLFRIGERMKLLGGRMQVDSQPGKGTIVALTLVPGTNGNAPKIEAAPLRLMLVDDHALIRESLRTTLAREHDITVVGEAGDGETALKMARELAPDMVLMDVAMPGLNGVETTLRMATENRGVKVLALSSHLERRFVTHMLNAGALGYINKAAGIHELLQGIRTAARGKRYLSEDVAEMLANVPPDKASQARLGRREIEVLKLIAKGESSPAIAQILHIATGTVEAHRAHLMEKLDLHNIAELTTYAIREALI